MADKIGYVALSYRPWSSVETSLGLALAAKMEDGSVGFLPVYSSADEAKREHPGCQVLAIAASKEVVDGEADRE